MRHVIEHPPGEPLLQVKDLCKTYTRRGRRVPVKALDSVSFNLRAGSSIAFVGESGSGKSTLVMCISRLLEPDSGEVLLGGTDLLQLSGSRLRGERSRVHMVFQDSATAFNPGMTAAQVVSEPMVIQGDLRASDRMERAAQLIARVGLSPDSLRRSPMQFSGGQRQRLAIARALAANAELIIFDESLSGLDMSVQAEIATLLLSLKAEQGPAFIFISHDIELAACLADEVAVMSGGRIVESAAPSRILRSSVHAATRALVSAILPLETRP